MAKVTTGTGDAGYTGLLGSERVAKYDPRPDTFGTLDEATSALGLARATTQDPKVKEIIYRIQNELYLLMGELATTPENYEKMGLRMTADHVHWLEQVEESLKQEVEIPNKFIIPGDTLDGAALDLARTIIRRAERMAVKLLHDGVIQNGEVIRYLNRLSDLVFILARYIEVKSTLAQRPE
ncbi:MAG TPA: cob(I)yrinic acid a,c-diamide adenosyltransferase [Ktedonobacteraceae bacterium]|nr:cob(I)yrinic acid a,c-diamide adenosyltransferase [Ktedonobacteraceae bacterium]